MIGIYVDPEDESATSIAVADRVRGDDFQGWVTNKYFVKSERYQRVTLMRVSGTAVEGRFTCSIPKDSDSPRGLLVLHPSESIIIIKRGRVYIASQLHHNNIIGIHNTTTILLLYMLFSQLTLTP